MKRAKLIYNPYSGDKSFKNNLDSVINILQTGGYRVTICRTLSIEDIYEEVKNSKDSHCIIASGGDGTISHIVNAMVNENLDIPLGVIPSGTANDFANHIGLHKNIDFCTKVIADGNIKEIDLGTINDRYFINVAAAGLLTDVSQKIDTHLKNTLGKLAYYIKGIEQLPNFRPIPVRITCDGKIYEENIYLFVILNGSTAGGFKLAPGAVENDGKLNLLALRDCNIVELFNVFIQILRGDHTSSNRVLYLEGKEFLIECNDQLEADVDGEVGPSFPLKVGVLHKKIKVFSP
ncbi:YegS/Rv2252/BmrU family lipid kinase [Clostridium cylindrosporum]|uniref:Diacylglycerol kinase DagK n=1 Tax=Clostridium cylindrosporum DSM 605 TaxID=1121307 RepID=A0A0J8D8Z9_CLOCY|nr:YegS/Rv2252/BmrU family lipid kinase [Clostridium cylindrosporum]KMT20829.1 diacylglycerol kinase DagK [Clostridium cylindrosporum DSM 605]